MSDPISPLTDDTAAERAGVLSPLALTRKLLEQEQKALQEMIEAIAPREKEIARLRELLVVNGKKVGRMFMPPVCGLGDCGGLIGPDITDRPICYRCGAPEMRLKREDMEQLIDRQLLKLRADMMGRIYP